MPLELVKPLSPEDYFYQWNNASYPKARLKPYKKVVFKDHDETPRDGGQGTYVHGFYDDVYMRIYYEHVLTDLKCTSVNAGFISPKPEHQHIIQKTAEFVRDYELGIDLTCAARMRSDDILPLIEISHRTGVQFEAGMFIDSSLIGEKVMGTKYSDWLDQIKRCITLAVEGGQRVMFILGDGSRTHPEKLAEVNEIAIDYGASRLCVTDTVGDLYQDGVLRLFNFYKKEIVRGRNIPIDFHGHNDLGEAVGNAIAAYRAGADRAHSTWFGIGERNGNFAKEQVMVNLALRGTPIDPESLLAIGAHKDMVAHIFGYTIPPNLPITGSASHETGTGVHTALIIMEREGLINGVGDLIYKPYHASMVGEQDRFVLNRNSGKSTVTLVLEQIKRILKRAGDINPNCSDLIKEAMVANAAQMVGSLSAKQVAGMYRRFALIESVSPKALEEFLAERAG